MRALWLIVAALALGAAGDERVVLNRARVVAEPRFWARHLTDVERGAKVEVLKTQGSWVMVQLHDGTKGYVPNSTFHDSGPIEVRTDVQVARSAGAAQAANASRGFSRELNAQRTQGRAELAAADAWVAKYEGAQNGSQLEAQLAERMPAFLKDGYLVAEAQP